MNTNREEKLLCHIAMVAKFLDEKKLKHHLKWIYRFSNFIDLINSVSFNLSHVDEISEFESERTLSKVRKKKMIFELCCPTL